MSINIGFRSGRLVVVNEAARRIYGGKSFRFWRCRCDCGQVREVAHSALTRKRSTSCGCLATEKINDFNRRHSHASHTAPSKTYSSWRAMRSRCLSATNPAYPEYGGRGIRICERWAGADSFPMFLSDMGERPPGTSLDRIDVNGHYEPSNCRWATPRQQSTNIRPRRAQRMAPQIHKLKASGITQAEIARRLGISQSAVSEIVRAARSA